MYARGTLLFFNDSTELHAFWNQIKDKTPNQKAGNGEAG